MATTYTLIASNVLTGLTGNVYFNSIPSTYTDLVVRWSARTDVGGTSDDIAIYINGAGSGYSTTWIKGSGTAASSSRESNSSWWRSSNGANASGSTASTFSNNELYIPNYLASQNKTGSGFTVREGNATAGEILGLAYLWQNTSAINQLLFSTLSGGNFVAGSSFYLYGIKNS